MPYADPEVDRVKAQERKRRYRARVHAQRYGSDAGDQRGKHGAHVSGSGHPRWNDSAIVSSHGYVKIRVGTEHPLADPNGYAYEHLLVWVSAGRDAPPAGYVIHHRNEIKTDNRLHNLQLMSREEHGQHHIQERSRDNAGRLLDGREWNELPQPESVAT